MSDDFISLSAKNIYYTVLGILSGLFVNQLGVRLYDTLGVTNQNSRVVIQIVLCCIIFAFIQTRVDRDFAIEWQNVTPGIFFTTFFFGVQYLSFTIEEGLYGIRPLPKKDTTATRETQRPELGV